jgi:hypothetical protein
MSEIIRHYGEIMTDPAHLAAEVSLMVLIDFLFLGLLWPVLRRAVNRRVHREHRAIDVEHGVDHDAPATGVSVAPHGLMGWLAEDSAH